MWDLGGQDQLRPSWSAYFQNTDAMIFVVDSNDTPNLLLAKMELYNALLSDDLKGCVLLVLANKQDVVGCRSVAQVREELPRLPLSSWWHTERRGWGVDGGGEEGRKEDQHCIFRYAKISTFLLWFVVMNGTYKAAAPSRVKGWKRGWIGSLIAFSNGRKSEELFKKFGFYFLKFSPVFFIGFTRELYKGINAVRLTHWFNEMLLFLASVV